MKKRFFAYSFVMTLMLLGAMYGHLHTGFSDMSTSDLIRILCVLSLLREDYKTSYIIFVKVDTCI